MIKRYARPYIKYIILAPVFMMAEVLADLMLPMLMANIIDGSQHAGENFSIYRHATVMFGITLLGLAGGVLCSYFATQFSQHYACDVRAALFNKIQEFSFKNLDNFTIGSLITRLTGDITQIQQAALMTLRIMIRAPLLAVGGIVMAVYTNRSLSLILLILIPLLLTILGLFIRAAYPKFKKMQGELDKVNSVMQENLSGVRVVKAFNMQQHEIENFGRFNSRYTAISRSVNQLMAFAMPMVSLITNVGMAAILYGASRMGLTGSIEVGSVMAFMQYLMQIMMSFTFVAMLLIFISRSRASEGRIKEVLATRPDITDDLATDEEVPGQAGDIRFENIAFKYHSAADSPNVLSNISHHITAKSFTAIIGGTGSGKSSFVNLVPRFYDINSGHLSVAGKNIKNYPLHMLRGLNAMVMQETVLFSGTLRDNIRWGKEDATEEEIIEASKLAQAHTFITEHPDGYDRRLGQKGAGLSGGQKQRIAIARALIRKPEILILDDAFSALDLKTEAAIYEGLKNYRRHLTLILIAQRINSVRHADEILIFNNGKIEDKGRHEELIGRSALYKEIYESQNNTLPE
jgi:ATP-binding cassette subfamily B multidrug efflux pump